MHRLTLPTSLGMLNLVADAQGEHLLRVEYLGNKLQLTPENVIAQSRLLKEAATQITAYLAGRLQCFNLPLKPEGTEFQQQIWHHLRQIPFGATVSYAALAAQAGNAKAIRAVGSACGANPLPLIIPCHRVLRTGGALGGFAWGLNVKEKLLSLESAAQQRAV